MARRMLVLEPRQLRSPPTPMLSSGPKRMCLCAWGSRKKEAPARSEPRRSSSLAIRLSKGSPDQTGNEGTVRRDGLEHIGVEIRLEGEHIVVRWTQSKWPEELEYLAHRDDVEPIDWMGLGIVR